MSFGEYSASFRRRQAERVGRALGAFEGELAIMSKVHKSTVQRSAVQRSAWTAWPVFTMLCLGAVSAAVSQLASAAGDAASGRAVT
ncbi:MAG TPA: hypothetical protein VHY20_15600, partial [Pirellulales bacterium]|nr:hypothetical protein [Pirellulales bacterium]